MKNLLLILVLAISTIANAQTLKQPERVKCNNDIKYNLDMAKKGYGEAEYILAMKFHYADPYDDTYKPYWSSYDSKDPFVAAAFWLKKACEHNWGPAYEEYAKYCFYGRGRAQGGTEEALKWFKKAVAKDSLNWNLKANEAICMWIINDQTFYTDKQFAFPRLIIDSPKIKGAQSDFIVKFALVCYHGMGNRKAYPKQAFSFFTDALKTSLFQENIDMKAVFYLIDCYRNGYGTQKDEKTATEFINSVLKFSKIEVDWSNPTSIQNATDFLLKEIEEEKAKDKAAMLKMNSFSDVFNLLY
jgi:hypothetical protein